LKSQRLVLISAYLLLMFGLVVTTTFISIRHYSDYAIRNYILAHPDVVVSAVKSYRGSLDLEQQAERDRFVAQNLERLNDDSMSPVGGNFPGTKVLVEFIDYQCPYCKAVAKTLDEFIVRDEQARIIYKELPILGDGSVLAARASLAAWKLGRFNDFHRYILGAKGTLDEELIKTIAKEAQIPWEKLSAIMEDPAINLELQRNKELAEAMNIKGTPAFIVGSRYVNFNIQNSEQIQGLLQARQD
jgi:protein-disulfide isomerase